MCDTGIVIDDLAHLAGRSGGEKSQGHRHDTPHRLTPDARLHTESRQMRTHQRQKPQHYTAHGETRRPPRQPHHFTLRGHSPGEQPAQQPPHDQIGQHPRHLAGHRQQQRQRHQPTPAPHIGAQSSQSHNHIQSTSSGGTDTDANAAPLAKAKLEQPPTVGNRLLWVKIRNPPITQYDDGRHPQHQPATTPVHYVSILFVRNDKQPPTADTSARHGMTNDG